MRRLGPIAAATIVLAGCGGSHYPVVLHSPRVSSSGPPLSGFAQFASSTRLGIITSGSSSCPSVPDKLVVLGRHAIRIHLVTGSWVNGRLVAHPPPGGACLLNLTTTPMFMAIDPKEIDVHRPLKVTFDYADGGKPEIRTAPPFKDG